MYPNPIHFPIPLFLPYVLETSPTKENKTNKKKKSLTIEAVVYHSVSHGVPFDHTASLADVHCSESLGWF